MNTKIELSIADAWDNKRTTWGFKPIGYKFEQLYKLTAKKAYTPNFFGDGEYQGIVHSGYRKGSCLAGFGQLIMFDFDDGITLDKAKKLMAQSAYEWLIVTTTSHTEEHHKFRLIINGKGLELDPSDTQSKRIYKHALVNIADDFGIKDYADPACFDAIRQYHPNLSGNQQHFYQAGQKLDWTPYVEQALKNPTAKETHGVKLIGDTEMKIGDNPTIYIPSDNDSMSFTDVLERYADASGEVHVQCSCPYDSHRNENAAMVYAFESGHAGVTCRSCDTTWRLIDPSHQTKAYQVRTEQIKPTRKPLDPEQIAKEFNEKVWTGEYGCTTSSALHATHADLANVFNLVMTSNERSRNRGHRYINSSPTGSGKSEMLIYYCSQLHRVLDDEHIGVLIVTKFIDEVDRIVEGIQKRSARGYDYCVPLHSRLDEKDEDGEYLYPEDARLIKAFPEKVKNVPILVTTHTAFSNRAKGVHFKQSLDDLYERDVFNNRFRERNLLVIDEAIDLLIEYQVHSDEMKLLMSVLETVLTYGWVKKMEEYPMICQHYLGQKVECV